MRKYNYSQIFLFTGILISMTVVFSGCPTISKTRIIYEKNVIIPNEGLLQDGIYECRVNDTIIKRGLAWNWIAKDFALIDIDKNVIIRHFSCAKMFDNMYLIQSETDAGYWYDLLKIENTKTFYITSFDDTPKWINKLAKRHNIKFEEVSAEETWGLGSYMIVIGSRSNLIDFTHQVAIKIQYNNSYWTRYTLQ